jgi:hypothetical protein
MSISANSISFPPARSALASASQTAFVLPAPEKKSNRVSGMSLLRYGSGDRAFLDYGALTPAHPSHGQHWGILIVELGVGVTVSAVMVAIYYAFVGRTPILSDEEW